MGKTAKILVPVDFSPNSGNAFRFALRLAAVWKGELHVLHVIYPQMENLDVPLAASGVATLTRKGLMKKRLAEFVAVESRAGLPATAAIPVIQLEVETGGAVAVIKSLVRKAAYDLVVLGTRGEHKTVETLLGTVASDVVGNVACPVIVVPEAMNDRSITRVAHAVEPHWTNHQKMLEVIRRYRTLHGETHLVRFTDLTDGKATVKLDRLQDELSRAFPDLKVKTYRLRKSNLFEDINRFIDREGIELLIMYRSTSRPFSRIFHRSLTREMAKHISIPLLVV